MKKSAYQLTRPLTPTLTSFPGFSGIDIKTSFQLEYPEIPIDTAFSSRSDFEKVRGARYEYVVTIKVIQELIQKKENIKVIQYINKALKLLLENSYIFESEKRNGEISKLYLRAGQALKNINELSKSLYYLRMASIYLFQLSFRLLKSMLSLRGAELCCNLLLVI